MFWFFSTLRYVKKIDEMIVVKVPLQPHIYYQNLVVSIYQNPGFLLAGHCFDMFIASFFLKKKNEQIGPESVYIDFLSSTESPWRKGLHTFEFGPKLFTDFIYSNWLRETII